MAFLWLWMDFRCNYQDLLIVSGFFGEAERAAMLASLYNQHFTDVFMIKFCPPTICFPSKKRDARIKGVNLLGYYGLAW